MYVDPLFDHLVIYHCDLETVCIAGLETAVSGLFSCFTLSRVSLYLSIDTMFCDFLSSLYDHLAANNSERPAICCVRKEIRNWNVYSFFTCFFSLESGILNSTAVRGHDCHPDAVHHSKRIKLRMCMLYITCTGVLLQLHGSVG